MTFDEIISIAIVNLFSLFFSFSIYPKYYPHSGHSKKSFKVNPRYMLI